MAKKSFLSGAVILMAAGFIVRVIGFYYRIYLSNLIGAEGMGLFQLISPVYSLVILTLTSGVSIAVSKLVAEETAKGRTANSRRITWCALVVVVVSGIFTSLLMLMKINYITDIILKDSRTYYSMLLLLPCIPVVAAASALKGYFYGIQDVTPTAYSQIVEQIVRTSLVMLTAQHFLKTGIEYACALATVAIAFGEVSNIVVLLIVYHMKKKRAFSAMPLGRTMRKRTILKKLLEISVPISSNRFITSIMAAIEVILIPRRLVAGGMDYQESMELYGRLTGMAMPLIFFPSIVTSSIAVTLVPAISEAVSTKNVKSVNYRISKSIQIAFILGFIFTALFMSYPDYIGNIIYKTENIGQILYSFSFTCIFVYLQQTLTGVLNGLGKQGKSLRNSTIGNAIRIAFVYLLIPVYGIQSYMWGMVASYTCVCIMNIYTVSRVTGLYIDLRNWVIKPGLVGIVMILTGKYIHSFFTIFIKVHTYGVICTVAGHLAVSLTLMTLAGVLRRHEIIRLLGIKKHQKSKHFYV